MSSRRLCPRHGLQKIGVTSKSIADRISERGRFEAGELVRVSFDRPKRSRVLWLDRSELADHAHLITYVGNIAHLKDFPTIAAIESSLVAVCSRCRDELLVRSGEEPVEPTSQESAFDTALIANDANVPELHLVCPRHGIVFPTASSPGVARAIDSGEGRCNSRLIKTICLSPTYDNVFWFEADFLRQVLGRETDLTSSTLRLEEGQAQNTLLEEAEAVCPSCLRDFLIRNGVEV